VIQLVYGFEGRGRGKRELLQIGAGGGRRRKPPLKLGVCGEQLGEPDSTAFSQEVGLDYISGSPYRLPIARLAAAQAASRAKLDALGGAPPAVVLA